MLKLRKLTLRLGDGIVGGDDFIKYPLRFFELPYATLPALDFCAFALKSFKRKFLFFNLGSLQADFLEVFADGHSVKGRFELTKLYAQVWYAMLDLGQLKKFSAFSKQTLILLSQFELVGQAGKFLKPEQLAQSIFAFATLKLFKATQCFLLYKAGVTQGRSVDTTYLGDDTRISYIEVGDEFFCWHTKFANSEDNSLALTTFDAACNSEFSWTNREGERDSSLGFAIEDEIVIALVFTLRTFFSPGKEGFAVESKVDAFKQS